MWFVVGNETFGHIIMYSTSIAGLVVPPFEWCALYRRTVHTYICCLLVCELMPPCFNTFVLVTSGGTNYNLGIWAIVVGNKVFVRSGVSIFNISYFVWLWLSHHNNLLFHTVFVTWVSGLPVGRFCKNKSVWTGNEGWHRMPKSLNLQNRTPQIPQPRRSSAKRSHLLLSLRVWILLRFPGYLWCFRNQGWMVRYV